MCVVSMIGDHFHDKWDPLRQYIPQQNPYTNISYTTLVTKEEFNKLKIEVEEMKALLKRAKIYDEKNNEPNCEIEEKMTFLREVAKLVGVDLDEIFKPK
jgi:hypothetical protein